MKDIKKILKDSMSQAVDKIKTLAEKEDIPVSEAFKQMDNDIEEALNAYGGDFFPKDDELVSLKSLCLELFSFKDMPTEDKLKERYEKLLDKCNPEKFKNDEKKHKAAQERTNKLNNAYKYLMDVIKEED